MNEEQLEAHTEQLRASVERTQRAHGWRWGRPSETRQSRLKRVRRYRKLPDHYPETASREGYGYRLVSQRQLGKVTLFVAGLTRPDYSEYIGSMESLPPFEQWPLREFFNGYCRFNTKPVWEPGYHGLLTYVPVHGGITYAHHRLGVSTYGFDTNHADDEANPLTRNVEWVEHQASVMACGIQAAALFEYKYLRSPNSYHRATIIQKYLRLIKRKIGQDLVITDNFGVMVNLLTGGL